MGNGSAKAQKSDQGTSTPLDTRPVLPIIDGHCHIFGHSLYEGGDTVKSFSSSNPWLMKGKRRFLIYTMSRDADNGRTVIDGVPEESGFNEVARGQFAKAAVPLLLDMGYTPLDFGFGMDLITGGGAGLPRAQERLTEQEQIARTNDARPNPDTTGKRILRIESLYCREMEDYTGDDAIRIEVYDGPNLLKILGPITVDHNGVTRMIAEDVIFDADVSDLRIKVYEEDAVDADDLLGIRPVLLDDANAEKWKVLKFGNSTEMRQAGTASSSAAKGTHYELTYKVSKKPSANSNRSSGGSGTKHILTIEHLICKDQEDWTGSDSVRIETSPAPKQKIPAISAKSGNTYAVNRQVVFADKVKLQLWEEDVEGDDDLGTVEIGPDSVRRAVASFTKSSGAEYELVYSVDPGEQAEPDDEYYEPGENFWWFRRDKNVYEGTIEMLSRVAASMPGQIWPLVPFEPRRPDALDYVKKALNEQGFVGVKLYSRCGWMPLHNREIYGDKLGAKLDARLEKLFDYLVDNDIPVLNHTSPTGFPPDGQLAFPRGYINTQSPGPTRSFTKPGMPPIWTARPTGFDTLASLRKSIHDAAIQFAKYCHYVQKTTSPYAWAPVLDGRWSKLRLCFAHSGSDIAIYHRYKKTIDDALAADANLKKAFEKSELFESRIRDNPFVYPGSEFRAMFAAKLLHECRNQVKGADDLGETERFTDEETMAEINAYLDQSEWASWFDAWKHAYPDSWIDRIIKYERSHANVYSDISYISGDSAPVFQKLVEVIVSDAAFGKGAVGGPDGTIMATKHFIGTDWYMIELSEMRPQDFWARVKIAMADSLKAHKSKSLPWTAHELFGKWTTTNCLDWLNIRPRLHQSGFKALDQFYKKNNRHPRTGAPVKPPVWWPSIDSYYD